jgi:hypothetical protein
LQFNCFIVGKSLRFIIPAFHEFIPVHCSSRHLLLIAVQCCSRQFSSRCSRCSSV